MLTRKQKYARCAFEQVSEFKTASEDSRKRYGSMAHKLPVLIRTAGLAQALAFVESRTPDEYKELLKHLEKTVLGEDVKSGKLRELSQSAPIGEYIRLTQNCLSALLWYKRFAESVLDVKSGEKVNDAEELET